MRIRRSEETAAEERDDYREDPGDTPDEPFLVAVPRAQGDYQYQYDVNDSSHMYLPSFVYAGGVPPVFSSSPAAITVSQVYEQI